MYWVHIDINLLRVLVNSSGLLQASTEVHKYTKKNRNKMNKWGKNDNFIIIVQRKCIFQGNHMPTKDNKKLAVSMMK